MKTANRDARLLTHLRYCAHFQSKHGYMPDVRESADGLAVSLNMAQRDRDALAGMGMLDKQPGAARAFTITTIGWRWLRSEYPAEFDMYEATSSRGRFDDNLARHGLRRIPLLDAEIAAGLSRQLDGPIDASQADDYLITLSDIAGNWPEVFSIKVVGDSMVDAHILPGDWVILRRTNVAMDGEIVAAQLADGKITLKQFERHGSAIHLVGANAAYKEPIIILDSGDQSDERHETPVSILGVCIGLMRGSASEVRVGASSFR